MEREVWRLSDDAVYRCRNSTLYVGGSEESAPHFVFILAESLKDKTPAPQRDEIKQTNAYTIKRNENETYVDAKPKRTVESKD